MGSIDKELIRKVIRTTPRRSATATEQQLAINLKLGQDLHQVDHQQDGSATSAAGGRLRGDARGREGP
jgi:hypothetical protein